MGSSSWAEANTKPSQSAITRALSHALRKICHRRDGLTPPTYFTPVKSGGSWLLGCILIWANHSPPCKFVRKKKSLASHAGRSGTLGRAVSPGAVGVGLWHTLKGATLAVINAALGRPPQKLDLCSRWKLLLHLLAKTPDGLQGHRVFPSGLPPRQQRMSIGELCVRVRAREGDW